MDQQPEGYCSPSSRLILLLHGIHTGSVSPVQGLIQYLPAPVKYPDYGYILGVETRLLNPTIVGAILPFIEDGDMLIGHSNGAAVCYELACLTNAKLKRLVLINAALEQTIIRPVSTPAIDVYFNAGDEITEAAKVGAALGVDDPVWGEMGHAGYKGSDTAVSNFDCGATQNMPVVSGHSDFFTIGNLSVWGPFLASRLT